MVSTNSLSINANSKVLSTVPQTEAQVNSRATSPAGPSAGTATATTAAISKASQPKLRMSLPVLIVPATFFTLQRMLSISSAEGAAALTDKALSLDCVAGT